MMVQGSCACGENSVKARSKVPWLGLETLNWGVGTLVTAAMEAGQQRNGGGSDTVTQSTASLGAQGTAGRGRI